MECQSEESIEIAVVNVSGDTIELNVSGLLFDAEIAEIIVSQNFCKSWWVTPPPSWGHISHILARIKAAIDVQNLLITENQQNIRQQLAQAEAELRQAKQGKIFILPNLHKGRHVWHNCCI